MMLDNNKNGFALLYAILVATIVLSVGIILGTIVTKQLVLSSIATNSQIAYYASEAGFQCALYHNKQHQFGYTTDGQYVQDNDPFAMGNQWDTNIQCGGGDINFTVQTEGRMSFEMYLGGETESCARVEVSFNPDIRVRSRGYSLSDGSNCGSSNSLRLVERVLASGQLD